MAIGYSSLFNQNYNNGGVEWTAGNVAIGSYSLTHNNPISPITGVNNTAVGNTSLQMNTTGHENTAVGSAALSSNTTGQSNTATGYSALYTNTTGEENTAIGQGALYLNNGGANTAIGFSALSSNTSGVFNTANGYKALSGNTIGQFNTAMGLTALFSNTTASSNVAIGSYTLSKQAFNNGGNNYTTGNVAVGDYALYNNNPTSTTTGVFNTANGFNSLAENYTGSGNSALGYNSVPGSGFSNLSNTTCIGNGATATGNNQIVLGNANVTQFYCYGAFVGTTANAANLTVLNTGQIVRSTSSRRYKKDIVPLEINTSNIYKLKPVSYDSYTDNDRHFGLIAEDVAEIIPELATFAKEKDVVKGSTSDKMIPDAVQYPLLSVLLLKEVQKHEETITELKTTIIEMKKMLEAQQAQIDLLNKNITK